MLNKICDLLFAVMFAIALLVTVGIMHDKGPSTLGNVLILIHSTGLMWFTINTQFD